MENKSWRTYIIFHKNIVDEYYDMDKDFNNKNYVFLKTNEKYPAEYNKDKNYKIINEWDIGDFYVSRLQEKTYMAPSAIYHIFKNNKHKKFDAVGFMEYDLKFSETTTKDIQDIVNTNEKFIIPFSYQHPLKRLHGQTDIKIDKKNAIEMIFSDYNSYFKTKFKLNKYKEKIVTSQQSFMCDVETFERIMGFISHVIESKLCERPNSWGRPSTLMDRYIGIALMLDETPIISYSLKHMNMCQWRGYKKNK